MTSDYPVLTEVLGRYFRDQSSRNPGSSRQLVTDFINETPVDRLRAALSELDHLLQRGICEPQLTDMLQYELGCYLPPDEDTEASSWLMNLRKTLNDAVQR